MRPPEPIDLRLDRRQMRAADRQPFAGLEQDLAAADPGDLDQVDDAAPVDEIVSAPRPRKAPPGFFGQALAICTATGYNKKDNSRREAGRPGNMPAAS